MRVVYWGCGSLSFIVASFIIFVWWLLKDFELMPSKPFCHAYKIETGERIIVSGTCDASFTSVWCSYDVQLERKNRQIEVLGSGSSSSESEGYISLPSGPFHFLESANYSLITSDQAVYFRQNGDKQWTQWEYPIYDERIRLLNRALTPTHLSSRNLNIIVELPVSVYRFDRYDPKKEVLVLQSGNFHAVFHLQDGGFKFDEEKSIKASGRRPVPFPDGTKAEIMWMQLPHNWQKKANVNGQNVDVMKLKKLKGSRVLRREKVNIGQNSKILWQNRQSLIEVLPLYGDYDKRFAQIKTHVRGVNGNSTKYLFVPLERWQSATRFSENTVSPFPFVRLTQRK
jgi:hypothetical protein